MSDDHGDLDAGVGEPEADAAEPVGPEELEAEADECLQDPEEAQHDIDETLYDPSEEFHDACDIGELATPIGPDGMPDHSADPVAEGALPFAIETVCCIEDDRKYVEMFEDELQGRPGWRFMTGSPDGKYHCVPLGYGRLCEQILGEHGGPPLAEKPEGWPPMICATSRYDSVGNEVEREQHDPDAVIERWGEPFVEFNGALVPVRPLRERCRYYARQHFASDDQPDPKQRGHHVWYRFCSHPARRSIGGASLSLKDQAIYGCDLRDPHDAASLAWLDDHDRRTVRERPDLRRLPMLGLEGDEVIAPDPYAGGGIFGSK